MLPQNCDTESLKSSSTTHNWWSKFPTEETLWRIKTCDSALSPHFRVMCTPSILSAHARTKFEKIRFSIICAYMTLMCLICALTWGVCITRKYGPRQRSVACLYTEKFAFVTQLKFWASTMATYKQESAHFFIHGLKCWTSEGAKVTALKKCAKFCGLCDFVGENPFGTSINSSSELPLYFSIRRRDFLLWLNIKRHYWHTG